VIRLRATFLLLLCLTFTACSSPQAVIPSSTPSPSPIPSLTPTDQPTSSPTVVVSESTPTVGSDETSTPEVDQTYIPGTTKESDFPLTETDQMARLKCELGEVVVLETPIPYGDTEYEITAYAKSCRFSTGKTIEHLVLGLRNLQDGSDILLYGKPRYEGPFLPPWLIEQSFENNGVKKGLIIAIRFGYKNEANAIWLGTDEYATDIINAQYLQANLAEFVRTGDPLVLSLTDGWFIPAQFALDK